MSEDDAGRMVLRNAVIRFMSMAPTHRLAILHDLLGDHVTWEDDTPPNWPALLTEVRERGLTEQLLERVRT